MDNNRLTPEQIAVREKRRQQSIRKQKQREYRKIVITMQIIVLLVVSVLVSCLIFIPGNSSLVSGQAVHPGISTSTPDAPVITKPDYSFLVTKLTKEINSKSAILLDLASEQVLAEKFSTEKIFPASLTKIMTALVVIENFDDLENAIVMPNDMYTYLVEQNASVAGFMAGEEVKIIDLLHGVLLPSGADACLSLARFVSGNEQAFAKKMTDRAHELGAVNTNFVNSTGLHDDNHYTTVKDLSVILTYALKNETFRKIFTTNTYTTSPTNMHQYGLTMSNTTFKAFERGGIENKYVKGGKTGFTGEACLCLATLAQKNGREYILITVGAGSSTSSKGVQHVQDAVYIYDNYT